ncbi:MAG: hypothetical protein AAF670_11955 [Planctomycetota bacterium]
MRRRLVWVTMLGCLCFISVGCDGGSDTVVAPSSEEEAAQMQAEMDAYEAELAAEESAGP